MKVSNLLFICLFLFTFAYKLTVAASTSNTLQPVNLFQKRTSQAVCTCPRCPDKVNINNFLFSTEVNCPTKCPTGYYVNGMDLLISPFNDYHTYIIETTSTDTSNKINDLSKDQTRYNLGDCFSASTSLNLDTTDYTTKITCKNAITQCSVQVKNVCFCSKSPSKLVIIAPSLVVTGSKYTPEVRIVDNDGNIVPRNYLIEFISPGQSYTSMASNGIMKVNELIAPSSGTVSLRASISSLSGSAPSLTSAEFTVTVTQSLFTCYGASPSNSSVCSGKGTCTAQDVCSCFTGYSGSKCETSSSTQVSSIKLSVPSTVNSGSQFTATVSMLDSSGNTMKSGSGTITLDIVGASSDVTMVGEKSKVAGEGVASFSVQLSTLTSTSISLKANYQTLSDTKSVNVDISRTSQCAAIWSYLFTITFFVILFTI